VTRPGRSRRRSDPGSAVIEFIVVAVGALVPITYLVLAAACVQAAAFASSQAVREAGRAFSTASTEEEGRQRALAAARLAFADHGIALPPGALRVTCPEGPCLTPGSVVAVDLSWSVALPWLPGSLDADVPPRVPVTATHRLPVDDLRSSPGQGS
jgi:hypothetical protein